MTTEPGRWRCLTRSSIASPESARPRRDRVESAGHRDLRGTFDGNGHTVTLAPGSLAADAVGEHAHIARCHHHQAVLDLGEGLVVTGRADSDGVTEAIELADGGWVLGVQGHPEADDRSRLFGALVEAAREYASPRLGSSGSRSR